MTNSEAPTATKREGPYHHGDLRNALIAAAAELAGAGGPEAVTVRAAARQVGVTPTAAYRHFANHEELLRAIQEQAQQMLFRAMTEAVPEDASPIDRLLASGRGYVLLATRERGLFRTAFCQYDGETDEAPPTDAPGFALLGRLLDALVDSGYLAADDRPGAEIAAWAPVHGLASLIVDGVLPWLDEAGIEAAIASTLAVVGRGLATGPNAPHVSH
ncbi:TetR/AcrR family transcriptional regulator [Nocardia thailandica]